jgi:hypothetical protein
VTQGATCPWTAQTAAPFLTIVGGVNGVGSGTITVSAPANQGAGRSGTLDIAGVTVNVFQNPADCITSVSPLAQQFLAAGGVAELTVVAPADCVWSPETEAAFITFPAGRVFSGSRTLTYQLGPNPGSAAREAVITFERRFEVILMQGGNAASVLVQLDGRDFFDQRLDRPSRVRPVIGHEGQASHVER